MAESTVPVGAVVLRLPTADLPPIAQQPGRRGRHPKVVASLWCERFNRSPRLRELALMASRERAMLAQDESDHLYMAAVDNLLRAQEEKRRLGDEFRALANLVKQIDAEIAALAWRQPQA
jgi:hypothetical protein